MYTKVLQITPNPHYTLAIKGTPQLDVNRRLRGRGFYSQPLLSMPGPGRLPQYRCMPVISTIKSKIHKREGEHWNITFTIHNYITALPDQTPAPHYVKITPPPAPKALLLFLCNIENLGVAWRRG